MTTKWSFDQQFIKDVIDKGYVLLEDPKLTKSKKNNIRIDINKFHFDIAGKIRQVLHYPYLLPFSFFLIRALIYITIYSKKCYNFFSKKITNQLFLLICNYHIMYLINVIYKTFFCFTTIELFFLLYIINCLHYIFHSNYLHSFISFYSLKATHL